MARLTIAIPTFNRQEILRKTLPALLAQLSPDCRVLILDNHSEPPVDPQWVASLDTRGAKIDLTRHPCNIGGNANVLRCLEWCRTEYLWILGDDDPVAPDAIRTIMDHLDAHPEALFFHFYCENPGHRCRTACCVVETPAGFLREIESIGEAVFISSYVYKVPLLLPHLHMAYFFAYTCAPQLLVILAAMEASGRPGVLSPRQVAANGGFQTSPQQQGALLTIARSLPLVLDAPFPPPVRAELVRLLENTAESWITPGRIFHQTVLRMRFSSDGEDGRRFFWLAADRLFGLCRKPRILFQVFLFGLLLRFPRLSFVLLQIFYILFKKERTGRHLMRNSRSF